MKANVIFDVVIVLAAIAILGGCSQKDQRDAVDHFVKPTKVVIEVQVAGPIQRAQESNSEARTVVSEMTPQNVEVKKPVALEKIDQTAKAQDEALKGSKEATKSAVKDEKVITSQAKEIKSLKEKDPVVTWLRWIGIGLIVAGITAFIVGIVKSITTLVEFGGIAIAVGIACATLAAFFYWVVGVTAAVVLLWLVWRWYRSYKAGVSVVDSIDVAVQAGAIQMTDTVKKILSEWQSKDAKALVDSAQQKTTVSATTETTK